MTYIRSARGNVYEEGLEVSDLEQPVDEHGETIPRAVVIHGAVRIPAELSPALVERILRRSLERLEEAAGVVGARRLQELFDQVGAVLEHVEASGTVHITPGKKVSP